MKVILLSGGSGQRLWPLTNGARAKQFIKVLMNEQGHPESMIQRVWRQLVGSGLADKAVFAIGKDQQVMLHKQLGKEIRMVIEPERRDTFPAIALVAAYFNSVERISLQEVIGVIPVDPMVDDSFFERVNETEEILTRSGADLALIGALPTFPTEKYGYIIPEARGSQENYWVVKEFKEKPQPVEAQKLMEQKALWNCGVFAFRLNFLLKILEEQNLPTDYDKLLAHYDLLPKISFDYQVVERSRNIVVLPYTGRWKDLGTWNALTEEMPQKVLGKGIISGSDNVHLINELSIPVLAVGLSNSVVVATPDGILVSDKQMSPQIKQFVGKIEQRPMYEERGWGWYKVLEHVNYDDGYEILVKRLGISAGKNLSYQRHFQRSETWTIVQGRGEVALNGVILSVKAGSVLEISQGDAHSLHAITDLEVIEIQKGSHLVEQDIERILFSWSEIERECCHKR
ncbi:sugar phosphate nucleotidyltransferase [Desulfitobacterium chlororespirans]|uniref:Mannose-1-phosphate guanylyltransferase n=1 Tax=Desulfitobacterium chlororespirans DSM 11544 TaxID=1121395 RepID=A0A1M7U6W2_9FIRM|nr:MULTISPECIES: sugar phosphate nucleotidyltransferase [Desulfitobacterium]SHN78698.1 mannose-1-phosphate guanylyltransferase [Desulfitobacterium chlororespirans DSM 11544]